MKTKHRNVQIALVSIGIILFALTYLYYPNLNRTNFFERQHEKKEFEETVNNEQTTTFENLEFKGMYDFDKPFKIESGNAYIYNEEPDLVYMDNMLVTLYLSDGRTVVITSDKGRYNKRTYDCFFEQNVEATDGGTKISADNLDLLATKNFVEIYNNVNLDHITGSLRADKIDYNFETKHFTVSMFDDNSIKMKVIQ